MVTIDEKRAIGDKKQKNRNPNEKVQNPVVSSWSSQDDSLPGRIHILSSPSLLTRGAAIHIFTLESESDVEGNPESKMSFGECIIGAVYHIRVRYIRLCLQRDLYTSLLFLHVWTRSVEHPEHPDKHGQSCCKMIMDPRQRQRSRRFQCWKPGSWGRTSVRAVEHE